jgi:hypothetical protein
LPFNSVCRTKPLVIDKVGLKEQHHKNFLLCFSSKKLSISFKETGHNSDTVPLNMVVFGWQEGSVVYAWDIIPFPVPESKEGQEQEVFSHLLLNLQTDSAYVVNIKVGNTHSTLEPYALYINFFKRQGFPGPSDLWIVT